MKTKKYLFLFGFIIIHFCVAEFALAQSNYWQQTNGPNTGGVSSILVFTNGDILVGGQYGIFRSTNNCASWARSKAPIKTTAIVKDINLFAGVTSYDGRSTSQTGVYYSADGGLTWIQTVMHYSVNTLIATTSHCILAGTLYGCYKSTDNGASWLLLNNGLPSTSITYISTLYEKTNNEIIAGMSNGGIYFSYDNGNSWIQKSSLGFYVFAIVQTTSGSLLAGGNGGLFRSTDNGLTWTQQSPKNIHVSCFAKSITGQLLAGTSIGVLSSINIDTSWFMLPSSLITSTLSFGKDNSILAANNSGLFRSTDVGFSWTQFGIPATSVNALAADSAGRVIAGGDWGISISSNNGDSWTNTIPTPGLSFFSLGIGANNKIFAGGGSYGGLYCSTNNGNSWDFLGFSGTTIWSLDSDEGGTILAGTDQGAFLSNNNGTSWISINNGLPTYHLIYEIKKKSVSAFFARAGFGSPIYRTTDGGLSWISIGLNDKYPNSIGVHPNGSIFCGSEYGVFRSTDDGNTWTEWNKGLIGLQISTLYIDRNGNTLLSTASDGVFQLDNNGQNWISMNTGLSSTVNTFITNSQGYIFAGADFSGILRSSYLVTHVNADIEAPLSFALLQNYPNPFNPRTTIKFDIPYLSFVTLRIFDLLGREVRTLVNEELQHGSYERVFDGNGNASGVYLCRLQTRNSLQIKKLLLIK
jgi:photosystem II stability/assembly factor-like uncharacterized protein